MGKDIYETSLKNLAARAPMHTQGTSAPPRGTSSNAAFLSRTDWREKSAAASSRRAGPPGAWRDFTPERFPARRFRPGRLEVQSRDSVPLRSIAPSEQPPPKRKRTQRARRARLAWRTICALRCPLCPWRFAGLAVCLASPQKASLEARETFL